MSKQIMVPDIGADEVEVTEIMVAVGDKVELDQSLIAVEGDKASMEVPAPAAGIVKEILIKVGDKVATGSQIMIFEAEGAAAPAPAQVAAPVAAAAPAAPVAAARKDVHVPDIGDDEVDVTEIMVAVGDMVEADQSIIAVGGDKAFMEVPAPFAGRVVEIKVAAGAKVATGSLVMVFEVAGAAPVAFAAPVETAASVAAAPVAAAAKEVNVPDIGGDEVEVTEIMVAVGDKVSTGSLIMVFEVAGAAPAAAAPVAQAAAPVAAAPVAAAPVAAAPAPVAQAAAASDFVANDAYVHAAPAVRRLAREFGINLAKVKASGRKGRIVKEDVQAYVKDAVKRAESAPAAGTGNGMSVLPWPKVDFSKFGPVEELELTRIQKISGPALHRNWAMIPHVTQFDEADTTDLEAFRKEQNAMLEKQKSDVKITPLVFILKAAAKALEAHPRFCSALSEDGSKLIMKKYIHIGVAVDTPGGLVVPVVRDVNKKGIYELSRDLAEISKKARAGKLTAADMQGGCFTISSLGGIGGTSFTPIVNAPEVAILGVSKSEMKPKWNGKEFVPRLMLPLALSYDHRVIDGADGARFVTTLSGVLSDIRRLVL
ncbi:dihydrolipoyllysine-residue acetyltransferase [Aeromonas salmonicida]|uniref:dihydrolipoyllysine-residue acetyltransferase n=1 Tax=Aeromonas salmonicida TaxID=645 RepID=UPI00366C4741